MEPIAARLKQLGATYILLERWEKDPHRYRFCCEFPGANPEQRRRFEFVDDDPIRAMTHVLDDVESSMKETSEAREVARPMAAPAAGS